MKTKTPLTLALASLGMLTAAIADSKPANPAAENATNDTAPAADTLTFSIVTYSGGG